MEKKDCFAWNKDHCRVLKSSYCKDEECRFYMCNEEYMAKREKAIKKLEN